MKFHRTLGPAVTDMQAGPRPLISSFSQPLPVVVTTPPAPESAKTAACETWRSATPPPLAWRIFEVLVAASALLLTSPILLLIALIIRRGTPGPALFFQQRVGLNQK